MAATRVSLLVFVVTIWAVEYADCASPHAPAPAVDCSSLILNMADCLSFVSNGSSVSKPEGTCCSGLKTVLKADAACLCEAFRSSAQLGVVLNVTKAMTLPSACKVSAPAATNCKLTDAPAAAPAVAVSPESSSSPAASPSLSVEAPAPSPGSSSAAASVRLVSGGSIIAIGLAVAISLF